MEKVIYLLWREAASNAEDFAMRVHGDLATSLTTLPGVRGVQANVQDADVAAAKMGQSCEQPPIDALLQVWLDSAITMFRQSVDDAIARVVARHAAYLVTESQPLVNTRHLPQLVGKRTYGFAQIAVLRKPARLDVSTWLDIWHNSHTRIAIDTQDTFEYRQNVVVRALTEGAPAIDAIVEECFPPAAMTDYLSFFDAPGDEAKFRKNLALMMDSVSRFIEPGSIDVLPTSQYRISL